ncbi:MAG TPA: hypothetical protein VGX50_18610 [Longimicrobium sp.]|nr:hypothetical protein [Longimicrobium sp.]
MNMIRRTIIHAFAAAAIGIVSAASPAAGAPPPPVTTAAQCVLEPGVYGIVDSTGTLVGILIVYQDCRIEVFKKEEFK